MLLGFGVEFFAALGAFQLHHIRSGGHEWKSLAQPLWPLCEPQARNAGGQNHIESTVQLRYGGEADCA
jgi:hypothetical protein